MPCAHQCWGGGGGGGGGGVDKHLAMSCSTLPCLVPANARGMHYAVPCAR